MSWLFFSIFSIILTCVKNGLWNKNIANASKWLTSLYHTMLESYDDSKVLQFRNLWRMPVIFVTVLEVSYEKRSAKSVVLLLKSPRKKKNPLLLLSTVCPSISFLLDYTLVSKVKAFKFYGLFLVYLCPLTFIKTS